MSYPGVPRQLSDALAWCSRIADVVNAIMQGRTNNYETVTLTANATSTTVTLADGRLATSSLILFEPTTLNAAIEMYGGTMYRSSTDVLNRQFVITHSNDASTDRTFLFAIVG